MRELIKQYTSTIETFVKYANRMRSEPTQMTTSYKVPIRKTIGLGFQCAFILFRGQSTPLHPFPIQYVHYE